MTKPIALIGYSGHAWVAYDILKAQNYSVVAYADLQLKEKNPYQLHYLGNVAEADTQKALKAYHYFISIGDNFFRKQNDALLSPLLGSPIQAIHPYSWVSPSVQLEAGVMVGAGVVIQAFCQIGRGVICNTNASIDHECIIGDFSHIAPQATLCGQVQIGEACLIGANAVIKPGIRVGDGAIVGAGTVVLEDVPAKAMVRGNPAR